jgi:hypothetical protein
LVGFDAPRDGNVDQRFINAARQRRLILTRDAARKDAFVGLRIRYFDAPHYGKMKILVL